MNCSTPQSPPRFDDSSPHTVRQARTPPIDLLPHLTVTSPGRNAIDLGGIAKGFAVDRAVATLRACGVPQGLVNAGGDVAVFGSEAVAVHVRDPRHLGRTLLRLEIRDEAIASSASAFDRSSDTLGMAMIIDPGARRPATAIHGATVRAPLCALADALTKLVILAGQSAETLLAKYDASALLVPRTGDMFVTQSWAEEMPAS
jgi:thiamine biosynthesis lipoprotein